MQYALHELSKLNLEIRPGDIIFLKGNLWAGKTTLTQEIASRLWVAKTRIKSPTYTYVQRYELPDGGILYHFDLYRISDYETFLNIGGEEYLNDPNAIKIIEWPDLLENTYVPDIEIHIRETGDPAVREITISRYPSAETAHQKMLS